MEEKDCKKDISELVFMVRWLLEYAEFDEDLTEIRDEKTYNFNSTVIAISKEQKDILEEIVNKWY